MPSEPYDGVGDPAVLRPTLDARRTSIAPPGRYRSLSGREWLRPRARTSKRGERVELSPFDVPGMDCVCAIRLDPSAADPDGVTDLDMPRGALLPGKTWFEGPPDVWGLD